MVLGFAASQIGGTVIQMSITFGAAIGGPTMNMFLMGVFLPFINWKVGISFLKILFYVKIVFFGCLPIIVRIELITWPSH